MGRISPDTVSAVEQATDIVSLISEYIPLKRSGKDFKALCPFHNEKTPSFYVSPSKQIYKCFGCGEGGNAFGFVMAVERLSFVEAVRMLAEKAGIRMEETYSPPADGIDKEKLYRANEWAASEYERYLWEDPRGAPAREYLSGRGLEEAIAKRFRLGFAPASRDTLVSAVRRRGSTALRVLEKAGLALGSDRGEPYDRFRGRLMFPINDVRGRVIAFGGRTLGDETPKYLNSPETPVFSKGISLYGVDFAKQAALKSREVYVMEGYTDVLAAFQSGVEAAVATLGTALTSQHVRNLRRYADRVYLVYDSDFAGQKASDRGLDIFLEEEVEAYIMGLPSGKDPCDFLLERGAGEFMALKERAQEIFDFKVSLASSRHDLTTVAGQTRALDEILATVAKVPAGVKQELYLARNAVLRDLSERLRISESVLRERLKKGRSGRAAEVKESRKKYPPEEKWILESILAEPSLAEAAAARISPEEFTDADMAAVLSAVYETLSREGEVRLASVVTAAQELGGLVVTLAEDGSRQTNHHRRLGDCIDRIEAREKRRTRARLKRELLEGTKSGDTAAQDKLLRQYQKGL